jgi:hypothetical protein
MTPDWILAVGTVIFGVTTWATLAFGYARFRELGRLDSEAAGTAGLRPAADGRAVTGLPPDASSGPGTDGNEPAADEPAGTQGAPV